MCTDVHIPLRLWTMQRTIQRTMQRTMQRTIQHMVQHTGAGLPHSIDPLLVAPTPLAPRARRQGPRPNRAAARRDGGDHTATRARRAAAVLKCSGSQQPTQPPTASEAPQAAPQAREESPRRADAKVTLLCGSRSGAQPNIADDTDGFENSGATARQRATRRLADAFR